MDGKQFYDEAIDGDMSLALKAARRSMKNDLKQQSYTLDRAIEILKAQYEVSQKQEFVNQPVAHALYQVWRLFDEFEPRREKRKCSNK